MVHKIGAHSILISAALVFTFIAVVFNFAPNESMKELFGVSSFLYGIFVAFAISSSTERFNKVVEKLKTEEAHVLNIYTLSAVLGEKVQQKTQIYIDTYLISQIDYFLQEYWLTYPYFLELFKFYIQEVRPKKSDTLQEKAREEIINTLKTMMENRKQLEIHIRNSMTKLEWGCILALLVVMLSSIFSMNSGAVVSVVISVLLSVTAVVFVAVLWELDMLKWKDRKWVWADLTSLFKQLDLLPYYPNEIVQAGKVDLSSVKKARVVTYPNPYPDLSDKQVETVEI